MAASPNWRPPSSPHPKTQRPWRAWPSATRSCSSLKRQRYAGGRHSGGTAYACVGVPEGCVFFIGGSVRGREGGCGGEVSGWFVVCGFGCGSSGCGSCSRAGPVSGCGACSRAGPVFGRMPAQQLQQPRAWAHPGGEGECGWALRVCVLRVGGWGGGGCVFCESALPAAKNHYYYLFIITSISFGHLR